MNTFMPTPSNRFRPEAVPNHMKPLLSRNIDRTWLLASPPLSWMVRNLISSPFSANEMMTISMKVNEYVILFMQSGSFPSGKAMVNIP